jgi:hypothetical protein
MERTKVTDTQLYVVGEPISIVDALARLSRYPSRPARYDLPGPGLPDAITNDEIRRTRAVSSRISQVQGEWFINRGCSAPWVPVDADLREADPAAADGLYDAMLALYAHFESDAPSGVSLAKISKVLHLKRPGLFPILDSRLLRQYAQLARQAAQAYPARRYKRAHWAAIRTDLLRSSPGLALLRESLETQPLPLKNLQLVSDLRLLDMIIW